MMLIFLKSARGLHKNAHFFPIFLNIEYYNVQIFIYSFQQQNVVTNVFFFFFFFFFPISPTTL